ncbi:MAG: DUF3883 domain-containing protein [Bacteroidales bacterium]|nr:DUF3883 domain-containing protein [Bacteroidales bacterium]
MIDIKPLIRAYFLRKDIYPLERYKWQAVKCFQKHFFEKGESLSERLELALSDTDNLLTSRNYFPKRMLLQFAKEKEKETQKAIDDLYNPHIDLKSRVSSFMEQIESVFRTMQQEGYSDWKGRTNVQSYQDPHVVSVYLSMRYPDEFYIYKWTVFKDAAKRLGYTIKSKDKIDKLIEYQDFCDSIKQELLKEKECLAEYRNRLEIDDFTDDNYNMLTQDFVYAIAVHMNADYFQRRSKALARNEQTILSSEFIKATQTMPKFIGKKGIDYAKRDELNRFIGKKGECWVVNYERERLRKLNITADVRHTSQQDGDGLGYNVLSVEDDGITPRYIEVKTTTGGVEQPFFFTNTELEFSRINKEHYYIYRVCNFKRESEQADVLIIKGSLEELNAAPVAFKAVVGSLNK